MLHPVGDLPASVYWRRRALVAGILSCLLGGLSWLVVGHAGQPGGAVVAAGSTSGERPAPVPALEQVVPSLASVQVPTAPATTTGPAGGAPTSAPPAAAAAATTTPVPAGPVPCTDAMITVAVRPEQPTAPAGSKPTLTLVVTNVSGAPCVRALDKGLQEIVIVDSGGNRVWGSNDCFPESSSDPRLLAPGGQVGFPVVWSGLSSDPGCATPRVRLAAGTYTLRGRLGTAVSPDALLTLV